MNRNVFLLLCQFAFSQVFCQVLEKTENGVLLNYAPSAVLSKKYQNKYVGEDTQMDAQNLSFVGDIKSVLSTIENSIDSSMIKGLAQLELNSLSLNSLQYLLKGQNVVIINEAHDRIVQRTFIYNLLPYLKNYGFTHIAMETLNDKFTKELSATTGYYTSEPMMGEVFRKAVELGYNIVSYESDDSNNRDSVQAINLLNQIQVGETIHKTIIICGYGHLYEWSDSKENKMMAEYFKELSGIDPLTIDQVLFSENRPEIFLRTFYEAYHKDSLIIYDGKNGNVANILPPFCDIYVCHPPTIFVNNRPIQLIQNNDREFKMISKIPKKAVLVQAYLNSEIADPSCFDVKVPFDQTTYFNKGKCHLALKNGEYIIVVRDAKNKILKQFKYRP